MWALGVVVDMVLKTQTAIAGGRGFFTSASESKLVPELVLIPFIVSFNQSYRLQIAVLALFGLTALVKSHHAQLKANDIIRLPALALLAVIVLTFRDGQFKTASLFIAVFCILLALSSVITRQRAYDSLVVGAIVYLVANIAGWAAHIQSPGISNRLGGYETTSLFFTERIFFPFALSINETPYIAAAVFVAIIAMIRIRRRPHWYHWLGMLAAMFVLLAANNRTAILLAAALGIALTFTPRGVRMTAPYVVGAALLLPFYLVYTRPLFLSITEYVQSNSFIVRSGRTGRIMGLEGRDVIWNASIDFWTDHFPGIVPLIFGYGFRGHVESGAYLYFPSLTADFIRDRSTLHAHNSMLQALFDTGLVGMMILLVVTVLVVYRYGRSADLLPIFALTLMTALSGAVETNLTPGLGQLPAYLFLCLTFFVPVKAAPAVGSPAKPGDLLSTDRRTRTAKITSDVNA